MLKYYFYRYRKWIILIAAVILVPLLAYFACVGFVYFSYGYSPESIADTFWVLRNGYCAEVIDQGIEYKPLGDEMILRTDILRDTSGRKYYCENIGIRSTMGTYYVDTTSLAMDLESGSSTNYVYDEDWQLTDTVEVNYELYYLEADGYPVLIFISDEKPTDNAKIPPVTFYRNDQYVSYYAFGDLPEDFKIELSKESWEKEDFEGISQFYSEYQAMYGN